MDTFILIGGIGLVLASAAFGYFVGQQKSAPQGDDTGVDDPHLIKRNSVEYWQ